jgi:acetyl-CoA C-acetyltransferase
MTVRGEAAIAGVYEHPTREAPDTSTAELHADIIAGALADAGLEKDDVDGLCITWPGGMSTAAMADYLGLEGLSYVDSTNTGGASYVTHVGHAAAAIASGQADVVVTSLAGRPRSRDRDTGTQTRGGSRAPNSAFESPFGPSLVALYALAARRHMHEYGTTSEQLAEVRAAASYHAQFNEHALYQDPVTVEEVVESRLIADPLHLLDCCVITDGGGAAVVVSPEVAADLDREAPVVLGHGEAPSHHSGGDIDLTRSGARWSGPRAFEEAGVEPDDVDYASIYDSFTITVVETLEDLGFCAKGEGGAFVEGGALRAPDGELPFNTDGGGLSSNHPANQGGMTKVIEAVRQLRGEANEEVQVPDCELAVAHGSGGSLGSRMNASTLVLGGDGHV